MSNKSSVAVVGGNMAAFWRQRRAEIRAQARLGAGRTISPSLLEKAYTKNTSRYIAPDLVNRTGAHIIGWDVTCS
jgi:hypothetical protein